jgi:light-regulated signal transduction histidine kinase (bacteriophytochrome)
MPKDTKHREPAEFRAARQRSITISTDIACHELRSDRRLVKQILLNLAANAVKFNVPAAASPSRRAAAVMRSSWRFPIPASA